MSIVPVCLGLVALLTGIVALQMRRMTGAFVYRRGSRVLDLSPLRRARRRLAPRVSGNLSIAGVPIPLQDETKHFKMMGTTGTGKTTAILSLLERALERGDRAVIADPDGGYRSRLFMRARGDVLLNPFERDSVRWDLFSEIHSPYDVEQLARALIPATEDASGNEWRGYARTFLAALVRRCFETGRRDPTELWRLLVIASADELRSLVQGTPAQPFLDADNARMFGSIRSVMGSAVAALEFVQAQRAPAFSVRHWVRDGRGVLFIPYSAIQIAALRSIVATWIRLAIFEAMNSPEGRDQRLWFVVDELDALGPIDGLKDALARLRKFGGRCVLGFQAASQVSSTYGALEGQTILENCSNSLILRCSTGDNGGTARYASSLIGEREVERRQISRGRDRDGPWSAISRRSVNTSTQRYTEAAVLPSEIEQLPDLCGFLKYASMPEWRRVQLDRCR